MHLTTNTVLLYNLQIPYEHNMTERNNTARNCS
jgi:hypothetical protein